MDHFLKYGNGNHNCCFNHKEISVLEYLCKQYKEKEQERQESGVKNNDK